MRPSGLLFVSLCVALQRCSALHPARRHVGGPALQTRNSSQPAKAAGDNNQLDEFTAANGVKLKCKGEDFLADFRETYNVSNEDIKNLKWPGSWGGLTTRLSAEYPWSAGYIPNASADGRLELILLSGVESNAFRDRDFLGKYVKHVQKSKGTTFLPRFLAACQKQDWNSWLTGTNYWVVSLRAAKNRFHEQGTARKYVLSHGGWSSAVSWQPDASPWEQQEGFNPAFNGFEAIYLPKERKEELVDQLRKDTEMLAKLNLVDYQMWLQLEDVGPCDDTALANLCVNMAAAPTESATTCPSLQVGDVAINKRHGGYLASVRGNVLHTYNLIFVSILTPSNGIGISRRVWGGVQSFFSGDTYAERYQTGFMKYIEHRMITDGIDEGTSVREPTCECQSYHKRHAPGAPSGNASAPCVVPVLEAV